MVRDFANKLRLSFALLGCVSQKDLCSRFHEVNPATGFDLERSYKWMQGRSLPRSAGVYEDWAALLGTGMPTAWLKACSIDDFLDLLVRSHGVEREALSAQAGIPLRARHAAGRIGWTGGSLQRLLGTYACYSHAWSPHSEGRIIRGSLVIEAAREGLQAHYAEAIALGPVELQGPVTLVNRALCVDLANDERELRLSMWLLAPGALASVLAGIMSGVTIVDTESQPAATRILMVRIPGADAAQLATSNRYLDLARTPISEDLGALGLPAAAGELDALLEAFLRGDSAPGCLKTGAGDYARLALAIDRLVIAHGTALHPAMAAPAASGTPGAPLHQGP